MFRVIEEPEYDLEALKAKVDLRLVVTPGSPVHGDRPTKVCCLWHEERQASLHVYPTHMHCYGCGEHMDLLDFVAWREGLDTSRDFDRLCAIIEERYVGVVAPPPASSQRRERPEVMPRGVAEYMHGRLGERRAWFRGRGLTDATIDRELLGYDVKAYSIPVWSSAGELLTIRFRRDDVAFGPEAETCAKYWGMYGRNDALLYNAKALELVEDWRLAVLCEGELDALRLYQEGLPALSATNGVGAFDESMAGVVKAHHPEKVIVAYDQDEPGRLNAMRVAAMFGLRGRVARWPKEWGKDVTDALRRRPLEEFLITLLAAEPPQRVEAYWRATLRGVAWR